MIARTLEYGIIEKSLCDFRAGTVPFDDTGAWVHVGEKDIRSMLRI